MNSLKFNMRNSIFASVVCMVITFINITLCEPRQDADNVCINEILEKQNLLVGVPVQYPLEYERPCHGLLRCTKSEINTKIDHRIETVVKKVIRRVCCPGYVETPDSQCAPICLKPCNNGKCVAPNECQCSPEPTDIAPGYVGPYCDRFSCLKFNRWGSKCDRECDCPSNSYCSASTGKCICRAGWRGANCTQECTPSMNCDNLELPPILEPEANIIHETIPRDRSQRLDLPEALEQSANQVQEDESRGDPERQSYSFQSMIYLIVISFLVYTVIYFWYKFEKLKALLHNQAYGYGYTSSNSVYTTGSTNNTDSSLDGDNPKYAVPEKGPKNFTERYLIHPNIESRLVKSHQTSKPNLYSELGSIVYAPFEAKPDGVQSPGRVVKGNLQSTQEEHEYQVPRSVASPKPSIQDIMSRPLPRLNGSPQFEDSSNPIYEEIKPRSHSHK